MEQVDFYLLSAVDDVARLQTACRIASKGYDQGMTIYLQTNDAQQSGMLNDLLWTFSQESFIPHAIRESMTCWQKFPVQIGVTDSGVEELDLLISLQATVPGDVTNYKRVADLIGGDAEQKRLGRERFRHYREKGVEPKIHQL